MSASLVAVSSERPARLAVSPPLSTGPYSRPKEGRLPSLRSTTASAVASLPSALTLKGGSKSNALSDLSAAKAAGEARMHRLLDQSVQRLSRGQRKRLEKREAGERRRDFAAYAEALKKRVASARGEGEQPSASALEDLSGFEKALDEAEAEEQRRAAQGLSRKLKVTRKKKSRMKKLELQQYDAVVRFKAFQRSPLQVLDEHLRNSLQRQDKLQASQPKQKEKQKQKPSAVGTTKASR